MNISSLANGGVQEKINSALAQVLDNITDPNTSHKEKRKLNITLTFTANEERTVVETSINIKPTLAAQTDVATTLIVEKDWVTGIVHANELKSATPGQTYFDDDGYLKTDIGEPIEQIETVVDFNKKKKQG